MVKNNLLLWVRCLVVVVSAYVAFIGTSVQASTIGQAITNTASMSYNDDDGLRVTVLTNTVAFTIEPARTASTIEFFRYAPSAPDAQLHKINGSDFSPSGQLSGPFITMPAAARTDGVPINLTSSIPLTPASTYLSGELMFVRVTDLGQNGDPNKIETIVITVVTSDGDTITLRLYESGTDTGEFWAYVPSSRDGSAENDNVLTTPQGTLLTATYIDAFDQTEVSVDTALVDPYGRVFNALTGELINGAKVTLIDAKTGQPATVYGIDGVSIYPSTVFTGQNTTDSSGLVYDIRPGEFRFPLAPLGEYLVLVEPPNDSLTFASVLSAEDFVDLRNAPFVILDDASYGLNFTLAGTEPLNFDIPLDSSSDLVLNKTANPTIGDVGDYIQYRVRIENRGNEGTPVLLHDVLPRGFSYVEGSAKLDKVKIDDPIISATKQDLTFNLGPLLATGSLELNYVVHIGSNAGKGAAINSVVALNGNQEEISNTSRARVQLREDLFRSHSTIVGRISEKSCEGDEEWARNIKRGVGVAGVRLYMETGAYAVSDEDGLYHFEGVTAGTHVVQIDEETLPRGYAPMVCEENSRYAFRATSKFVEVKGGQIWRSNFYLKRVEDYVEEETEAVFDDQTEYKQYDQEWLEAQTPDVEWVYPLTTRTPSRPSVNIGIKHAPDQRVELVLNGRPVSLKNLESRTSDSQHRVMISRWRGVDLLEGRNHFEARIVDAQKNTVRTLTEDIYFVKTIARAIALPDQSTLAADGRTNPVLAVRLEDESGHPVHAGRITHIDVPAPYRVFNPSRLDGEDELITPLSARSDIVVGADGIAHITLEPTLQTGKVTIIVTLDDGREITLFMYLTPEKRDWIIVGLAEGSLAYNSLKNKTVALASAADEDLVRNGRVAFFAKGLVKGDWLMTLAVDTAKRRGNKDGNFRTEIDPNAYYTLYGDRSYTSFEGASRYPVYVKLEKRSFYAMFGDFETNITEGKLTRYSRHLSGLKAEFVGGTLQATLFGAETNQNFAKDEIAADGTSGPYQLSNAPILANSDTITIETRDRTRADVIIKTRTLIRNLDYTLDELTGEIIFRLPVNVTDGAFNPNVIVVDYETSLETERNLTYGGRVQKQILNGRVQIGSTFVHEGGSAKEAKAKADIVGAEVLAQLRKGTDFRAEIAASRTNTGENGSYETATAYLAEIVHTSEKLTADAYLRSEDGGFGLRQRSSATNGIRRYGANVSYKVSEFENEKTGRRGSRYIAASAYREENLGTNNERTAAEITFNHEGEALDASLGLRHVQDKFAAADTRQSLQLVSRLGYRLPQYGLTLGATREQSLGSKNQVGDFPTRTRLSLDKTITDKATVRISHDILDGENAGGQNTTIGVSYAPWAGTEITAGSDMITSDAGRRLGATVGVDQQFQLSEKWSASVGLTNRRILKAEGSIDQIAPDTAVSALETNESYTAAYIGAAYRAPKTNFSGRLEAREATDSNAYIGSFAAVRELSEKLSFAGAFRANYKEQTSRDDLGQINNSTATRFDGRLGLAWRPRDEGLIILDRFDVVIDDNLSDTKTVKFINNFAANAQLSDRWQLAGNYGVKYTQTEFENESYNGFTHLVGTETRFDITQRIDIGLHGSILYTSQDSAFNYAYGPSIGFSPKDNVWISLGYNVEGFYDGDFSAAEYAQRGPFIKLRVKFDQNTARGLLNFISPSQTRGK